MWRSLLATFAFAFAFALLLASALVRGDAAEPADPAPLTDTDVVRLVAAGRAEAEIIRVVSERRAAFDLSEEMVEELRGAGVTAPILEAMARRQRECAPEKARAAGPAPGFVALRVVLRREEAGAPTTVLYFPDTVDNELAATLQLGPRAQDRQVRDLAIFLACGSAEHVPELWRNSSPLGHDFVSMPPHQMIAFEAGAASVPADAVPDDVRAAFEDRSRSATPPARWIRLELPAAISGELEVPATHQLILGVAALIGEHYSCLASARIDGLTPDTGRTLYGSIELKRRHGRRFEVRLSPTPLAAP